MPGVAVSLGSVRAGVAKPGLTADVASVSCAQARQNRCSWEPGKG